jgi:hypothetical protein
MHSEKIALLEPEGSRLRRAGAGAYGNSFIAIRRWVGLGWGDCMQTGHLAPQKPSLALPCHASLRHRPLPPTQVTLGCPRPHCCHMSAAQALQQRGDG